jgi:hypothetical protein
VECNRRKHVAVLGHGHRRHPELLRLIEQLLDSACAVEQGVLGVEVEVDEIVHVSSPSVASFQFKVQSSK